MNQTYLHTLVKRLLWVYLLYTLARLLFCLFNASLFQQFPLRDLVYAFLVGLRFDTTSIAYTNGLYILLYLIPFPIQKKSGYKNLLKGLFIAINGLTLFLNLMDIGYYPFSGKRSGAELLALQNDISDQAVQYLHDYWFLALILVILISALIRFYPEENKSERPFPKVYQWLILTFSMGLLFIGGRGSWGLKPLNTLDASRLTEPGLAALALNTPFQFIMTYQQTGVSEKNYMSNNEASAVINFSHHHPSARPTRKNIVVIIVESLGKEYVGYYNNGKGYTPFLDSLALYSTVYNNAYANGKRSIEGIPAIVASMPSLMTNDYMNSYYQSNTLQSAGCLLSEIGYETSFYHGGKNGTMSFDNFISATKAGKYYGLNEYPNKKDNDGNWGIYDEPYLQYFVQQLNTFKQPFFSSVFTLSSHHPYNIPESQKSLFPEGSLPIHKTIRYTDFALKHFFEKARQTDWYANTLFIITADHASTNEQASYQTEEGIYRIPLIIFDPQHPQPHQINTTTQQIDLMPFILEEVGYNKPYFAFGKSSTDSSGFAIQYLNNIYQWIQYPYVLQFDGERTLLFSKLDTNDILKICNEEKPKNNMEHRVKAFVQQYNDALIHNKTTLRY